MLSSVLELLPNLKSTYFASMNPPTVHNDSIAIDAINTDDNEAIQSISSHTKEHGCNRETPSKKDSIQEKI